MLENITVTDILLWVMLIAVTILAIYLIVLVAKLLPGIGKLNTLLDDVQEIVNAAKASTADVQKAVSSITKTSDEIFSIVKGHKSKLSAAVGIVNAASSIARLFGF